MLSRVLNTAKANQPIATTGMFAHTYYWLTSPSGDLIYKNPSYKQEQNQDQETAIYFIHGTADQASAFQLVAARLIQAGLPNEISTLNLLSFDQRYQGKSIALFAQQLRDKIKANHHQRVILIGHSRGGLVASYFTEFLANSSGIEVPLVITVGTPFNGSYLAIKPLSWLSDSVREMEINSEFLLRLKKKIMESSMSLYHFFIAAEDAIVPSESGYIQEYVTKHPNSLTILDRHAHLSVMSSYRLVSHISKLLHDYFHSHSTNQEVIVTKLAEFTIIEDYIPEQSAYKTIKV